MSRIARYILIVLSANLFFTCATVGAQPAEVRVLGRDSADGGPVTLDRSAVEPLFSTGAPAQAAQCLASGDVDQCVDDIVAWISAHEDDPSLAQAQFLAGYLAHRDRDDEVAVEWLSRAAQSGTILADYAYFFAAQSAFRLERYDDVLTLTLSVPEDSIHAPRSQFLRGRALRRAGQLVDARRVLHGFVNAYPNAYYVAEVELELANTLVELELYTEAADLFARVSHRYPGSDEEETASRELRSLLPRLSEETRERLSRMSHEDLLARAQVLFDRHRSRAVIDLLEDELEELDVDTPLGCRATYLVGKSYSKLREHGNAVPFYQRIVASICDDEDLRVKSLYTAGQALWNVDRDSEAIDHFVRLYNEHATHSYADDAMLYEARIERSNGNEARFLQVLEEQVRRFPDGDMLGDANWLLFEHELGNRNYDTAIAFVQANAGRTGESSLYNRGRIAYFGARAAELSGEQSAAIAGYESVIRDVPLSYYALMAFNRMTSLDAERATAIAGELRVGATAPEDASIQVEPANIMEIPSFQRGLLLLKLGLMDLAGNQFDRLLDAYPNQDEPLWLVTFLFDCAGAYHLSHDIPRRRIGSFLTEYPTPDSADHFGMAYPVPFRDQVFEAASERDIDPYLVYAIMREESGFNPHVESWANARGLMQLMMPTAEDMADRVGRRSLRASDLFRPEVAITLGSEYLLTLSRQYDAHPMLVIAGYNGGIGNVNRFLRDNGTLPMDQFVEEIPYRQTRDYTKRVLMTYWIYHWLYDDQTPVLQLSLEPPRADE